MRPLVAAACAMLLSSVATASEAPAELQGVDAVEAWVRLKGDAGGALSYEWVRGAAHGIRLDELSRTLFEIESVTLRQFRRRGPGRYDERTHACRLYREATTGAYIDSFVNPYTGRLVALTPRCSAGPLTHYSPQRIDLPTGFRMQGNALDAPMRLQRIDTGDTVTFTRTSHAQFLAPSTGSLRRELAVDAFTLPARDFANAALTGLSPHYQWTSVGQWMTALEMGDTPGRMLWSVHGRNVARLEDLPPGFRAELARALPGALPQGFDWSAP